VLSTIHGTVNKSLKSYALSIFCEPFRYKMSAEYGVPRTGTAGGEKQATSNERRWTKFQLPDFQLPAPEKDTKIKDHALSYIFNHQLVHAVLSALQPFVDTTLVFTRSTFLLSIRVQGSSIVRDNLHYGSIRFFPSTIEKHVTIFILNLAFPYLYISLVVAVLYEPHC
jgi:hypothetical protein